MSKPPQCLKFNVKDDLSILSFPQCRQKRVRWCLQQLTYLLTDRVQVHNIILSYSEFLDISVIYVSYLSNVVLTAALYLYDYGTVVSTAPLLTLVTDHSIISAQVSLMVMREERPPLICSAQQRHQSDITCPQHSTLIHQQV